MTTDWTSYYGVESPTTPYWLEQYSPGQVAWQPLQKLPVKVPSGQQWARTNPSWMSGLESYINWAAGTPGVIASYEDLIALMNRMMLRRSPSRATQWYPAQQW